MLLKGDGQLHHMLYRMYATTSAHIILFFVQLFLNRASRGSEADVKNTSPILLRMPDENESLKACLYSTIKLISNMGLCPNGDQRIRLGGPLVAPQFAEKIICDKVV